MTRGLLGVVGRLPRRLNWALRRWSTADDRAFHDAAFARLTHDAFSPAYPGYLTIRRFADLAATHIRPADHVLDCGCGAGEITCELARRLPDCKFLGIDHSAEAIARADRLAARFGLTNVRFEIQDVERYEPQQRIGLATMFNAFHHLLDPAGFVGRIGRHCDRFFLIEPTGNWLGQWRKTLDLDWIAEAVFSIRDRLEYQWGLMPSASPGPVAPSPAGEPTEHRYGMDDFVRWFDGYGVDVRGTIAGLELYGVEPEATNALREDIGRIVYTLAVDIEDTLRRHDLDLAAKHWAVYAERGRSFPKRRVPSLPPHVVQRPLAGAYDVEYGPFEGPSEATIGTIVLATVHLVNRSWRVWDSGAGDRPVLVSYHWMNAKGAMVIEDGLRSPLPRPLAPGDGCRAALRVRCPDEPGRYTLAIDLVHEHVSWFSGAGTPPLRITVKIVR